MPRRVDTSKKLAELQQTVDGARTLLVVLQDTPDPDAIAAGVALRKIVNSCCNVSASLASGGQVGRAENRALIRYLDLNLRPIGEISLDRFDLVAMVDTQPGHGNTSYPPGRKVDIVIDHHSMRPESRRATFTDIRSNYGATSTILMEYLQEADLQPDPALATALLYGIRSDTQDFGRDGTAADIEAHELLYPLANKRVLGQIQRGQVTTAYFQTLRNALDNAARCGQTIYCDLGNVTNPDMVGELADLLLRHEESQYSLAWGYHEGQVHISVRCSGDSPTAEEIVRRIVGRRGSGGGHRTMAGGQIPVPRDTPAARKKLDKGIRERFLKVVGCEAETAVSLV